VNRFITYELHCVNLLILKVIILDNLSDLFFAALRNWFRSLTDSVWQAVKGGGVNAGFPISRLVTAIIIIAAVCVALDWLFYILRWRPHRVWISNMRRRRRGGGLSVETAPAMAYAEDAAENDAQFEYEPRQYFDDMDGLEDLAEPEIDTDELMFASDADYSAEEYEVPQSGEYQTGGAQDYGYPVQVEEVAPVSSYVSEPVYEEEAARQEDAYGGNLRPRFFPFRQRRQQGEILTVTGKPAKRRGLFNLVDDPDEAISGLPPLAESDGFYQPAMPAAEYDEDEYDFVAEPLTDDIIDEEPGEDNVFPL
jgi:hypothetical protein